jgi:hypothetical protein
MRIALPLFGLAVVGLGFFADGQRPARAIAAEVPAPAVATPRPGLAPTTDVSPPALADEPTAPPVDARLRATVERRARGAEDPAMEAFTAYADAYVDANLALVERKARAEGITVPEVRALTHLGLLALATQRVEDVEEILGRALEEEERDALAALLTDASDGLEQTLRGLVARGADARLRWDAIDDARTRYLEAYFGITGMDRDGLSELLGGDLLRRGARIAGTPAGSGTTVPAEPDDPRRSR